MDVAEEVLHMYAIGESGHMTKADDCIVILLGLKGTAQDSIIASAISNKNVTHGAKLLKEKVRSCFL